MKHRKSEHANVIKTCKNTTTCLFKKECWFKHEELDNNHNEDENNKNNESANIIQKLFKVVEKFTEKVTRLENLSLKNNQCIKYMKIVNYQRRRIN